MIPASFILELDSLILKSVQNDTQNVLATPIDFSKQRNPRPVGVVRVHQGLPEGIILAFCD
jgi:hypothetical protein